MSKLKVVQAFSPDYMQLFALVGVISHISALPAVEVPQCVSELSPPFHWYILK